MCVSMCVCVCGGGGGGNISFFILFFLHHNRTVTIAPDKVLFPNANIFLISL